MNGSVVGHKHNQLSITKADQFNYALWNSQASTASSSKTSKLINLASDCKHQAGQETGYLTRETPYPTVFPSSRLQKDDDIGVTDSYQQAIQSIQPSHRQVYDGTQPTLESTNEELG